MTPLAFLVLGLVFGSLATALSYRLPRGLPVGAARSRCPHCGVVLSAVDLVPVLSWLAARGRCRHCAHRLSWRYPLSELLCAGLFVLAWRQGGEDLALSAILALSAFGLVVIGLADWESGIIPDAMLSFLMPLALLWQWCQGGDWLDAFAGAAVGMGMSAGLRWAFRRWRGHEGLGLGDVKFLGVAGFYIGLSGLGVYLLLTGVLGLALGVGWRLAGRGPAFPFGPALCAGLLIALFHPDILAMPVSW